MAEPRDGVNINLPFEKAKMLASAGAGIRRAIWAPNTCVVMCFVPSARVAFPVWCFDGWFEDKSNMFRRYVPSVEDQSAQDWEARDMALDPVQQAIDEYGPATGGIN